ncbi:MAG TPA: hypothetical protein PKX15_03350 [Bacteroidales bacterium]|nr:hypothetical protein [Bacteroidales bacterium]
MSDETNTNSEKTVTNDVTEKLNQEITLPTDNVTVINVNELKNNSILIIKVDAPTPGHKMMIAPAFQKLLQPYGPAFKEKNITVMLMTTKEDLTVVTEEEMAAAGWEKKDKSVIINPFK